jgi:hypothetical protein
MKEERCTIDSVSSQGISDLAQTGVAMQFSRSVKHVPGLACQPCTRAVPLASNDGCCCRGDQHAARASALAGRPAAEPLALDGFIYRWGPVLELSQLQASKLT